MNFAQSPDAFGSYSYESGEGFSPALQLSPLKADTSLNFMSRKTTSFDSYYESLQTTAKLSPEEKGANELKFNFDTDFIGSQSLDFDSLEFETSCFL